MPFLEGNLGFCSVFIRAPVVESLLKEINSDTTVPGPAA